MKEYQRRVLFKTTVKDKWYSTYWWSCDLSELPYDLKQYIESLVKILDTSLVLIKIERRENPNYKEGDA